MLSILLMQHNYFQQLHNLPLWKSYSCIPNLFLESTSLTTVITGTNSNREYGLGGCSALLGCVAIRDNAAPENTRETIHWCMQQAAGQSGSDHEGAHYQVR
jgi:hypothetical protein